jgi:hypothetical protein
MRNTITRFDLGIPLVYSQTGMASTVFNLWVRQVTERGLLIGTGSPEGVVEAQQGVEYMDETGTTGSVKWIKQLADISGDKSQGWVAIG